MRKNQYNENPTVRPSQSLFIVTFFLLILWIPVSIDKLMGFEKFRLSMLNQPLPNWFTSALSYTVPILEIGIVMLLVFQRTRKTAFYLSLGLLIIYTGFISLGLLGFLKNALCSCGAVIKGMGWKTHILFNCFFLILSAYGIYLTKNNKVRFSSGDSHQGLVGQKTV